MNRVKIIFPNDDPRFNPDDLPEFKHGGLAKILEV